MQPNAPQNQTRFSSELQTNLTELNDVLSQIIEKVKAKHPASASDYQRLKKVSENWLTLYQSQSACFDLLLLNKIDNTNLFEQRLISRLGFILKLSHAIPLHPELCLNLTISAQLTEIAYFNILNKRKLSTTAELQKFKESNALKSAQICNRYLAPKDSQSQFIVNLMAYHKLWSLQASSDKITFAHQLLFLTNTVVNALHPITDSPKLTWQKVLKQLCLNYQDIIDKTVLDKVYCTFSAIPAGTQFLSNEQNYLSLKPYDESDYQDVLCLNNGEYEVLDKSTVLNAINHQSSKKITYSVLDDIAEQSTQLNPVSLNLAANIQAPSKLIELRNHAYKPQTSSKKLIQLIEKQPDIIAGLYDYAKSLSRGNKAPASVAQAVMTLGTNRLKDWIARQHIESSLFHCQHQLSRNSKQVLTLTQKVAQAIAIESNLVLPEQAKLLMSYLMMPATYHKCLTHRLSYKHNKLDTFDSPSLMQVPKQHYQKLSLVLANTWLENNAVKAACLHQLKPEKLFIGQDKEIKLLALSILSIHASYLIYQLGQYKMRSISDKNLQQSLKLLGLTKNQYEQAIEQSLSQTAVYCSVS
ncbi:HDOD domain-containing protein [Catenovulum sp. SM1970]|uniref:HDOD domain-containing protein n=1 Tax=Marinifaba aquimaris TaxID=2741323 RepID=UPI001573807E|nr:HDOD domain-containing protein [Marinifaba aquimaris]NTS77675.1 HDOD domain-containing protein [Marinifaba aquimaris]